MALETGRAGKTDLDWLEHLAGTAKMELQYVFQPGSGVQAAVQGRRITVNLGGEETAQLMLARLEGKEDLQEPVVRKLQTDIFMGKSIRRQG